MMLKKTHRLQSQSIMRISEKATVKLNLIEANTKNVCIGCHCTHVEPYKREVASFHQSTQGILKKLWKAM